MNPKLFSSFEQDVAISVKKRVCPLFFFVALKISIFQMSISELEKLISFFQKRLHTNESLPRVFWSWIGPFERIVLFAFLCQ